MKKVVSLCLCILMLVSALTVNVSGAQTDITQTSITAKEALKAYEKKTGETLSTNRYFFLMPNGENGNQSDDESVPEMLGQYPKSWYNEHTDSAGIYWWQSEHYNPDALTGYEMSPYDSDCVFYADVPTDVKSIVFNNNVDDSNNETSTVYAYAERTYDVPCEHYDAGESENYPNGTDSFNNMIYVIYPVQVNTTDLKSKQTWGGEWYYYYGQGCYGTVEGGNEHNCIRDDHDHINKVIHFDTNTTDWKDFEMVYCMVYSNVGSFYQPKMVATKCTDYDGDGVWTYDLNKSKIKLERYERYRISFSTDTNKSTEYLTMQIGNLTDTVYSTGEYSDDYSTQPIIAWTNPVELEFAPLVSLKDAISDYQAETGEAIETNRYYFLMPNGENGIKGKVKYGYYTNTYYGKYVDSWCNNYTNTAGIYWYGDSELNAPDYRGYTMEKGDSDGIFYADVPKSLKTFRFTNALEQGYYTLDNSTYYLAMKSDFVSTVLGGEYYPVYPDKDDYYDNMIYVLNPCENDEFYNSPPLEFSGDWYYYYGNGCYGKAKYGTQTECLRDDHTHEVKLNYEDEFYEFCATAADNLLTYSDPLYYYYEGDNKEPQWFLAQGYNSGIYDSVYGVFGDYYIKKYYCNAPSALSLYIYVFDEQKFYTLEDAWGKGIDGLELAFTEYLKPEGIADILGDTNQNGHLDIRDATYIQQALAELRKLYSDELAGEQCCGESIKYKSDFNRDGERSILDATAIQLRLAKLS